MDVIVCVDDHGGMAFNQRRVSRDRKVIEDILKMKDGCPLWADNYSLPLFAEVDAQAQVHTSPHFLTEAPDDACCFVERQSLAPFAARIQRVILYRWNRHYPADVHFDISLEGWQLVAQKEFGGHSHDTITREEYVR